MRRGPCLIAMAALAAAWPGFAGGPAPRMDELQQAAFRRMVRVVNAGDARAYALLYAPKATITIRGGPVLQGRPAIEAHEAELLREFPGARLAFHSVWQKGSAAVVHYAVNGRTPAGQAMGHEGLLFYRFLPAGLIAEERRYLDSLTPMAQMGALGPAPARPIPALPDGLKAYLSRGAAPTRRETDNVASLKASFAALDAEDEAAFLSGLTEDVILDELIDAEPYVGKERVKAWFGKWTSAVADARSEVVSALGVVDVVLVETVVRGTLNGRLGRVAASGKPFVVHRAAIVQLRDGKIGRITAFMNGKELAEAVGRWPPQTAK